ncbi:MAG: lectin [Gammaproteobacteria bacterium]|nr:lectin [Gammaproteobacteria bacterium]
MIRSVGYSSLAALLLTSFVYVSEVAEASDAADAGFFITSVGPGKGADLGGLAGADAHCQKLADTAGAGKKSWRAYLSTSAGDDSPAVNARDRIGDGPWYNVEGVLVAANVDALHGDNNLTKQTVLAEGGATINGRGDNPNRHDILTGSNLDGTAPDDDRTCGNWTSSSDGTALVGHHDRTGGGPNPTSWNSAHGTRGCSQENLKSTGGDGLFYCFAAD